MAGRGIFICYRRSDASGYVHALLTRLQTSLPSATVFVDVDGIVPGTDFQDEINRRVAESDIVLAVIGKDWIDARDEQGQRRLENPEDYVRLEIEAAIAQRKRLIPVLLDNVAMPKRNQLPDPLHPLAAKQAVPLRHDTFGPDVERFTQALAELLGVAHGQAAPPKEEYASGWAHREPQPVPFIGPILTVSRSARVGLSVALAIAAQLSAIAAAYGALGEDSFVLIMAVDLVAPLLLGFHLRSRTERRHILVVGLLQGAIVSAGMIALAVIESAGRSFNNYLLFIYPMMVIPITCILLAAPRAIGKPRKW